jgi:hypothetical protein
MKRLVFVALITLVTATFAEAKIDLVVLPTRDTAQLTIYNSADLTLVRESRTLTLKRGENQLQFSWANTLIDPTSLEMQPRAQADEIDILDLTFLPRVKNLGVWNIESEVSGKVPVEITYLTSGLSWRAFYMGTLSSNEKTMGLHGYVRVSNNSGEDYADAQTRLIVGKVHILDRIAELASREHPYGRPGPRPLPPAAYEAAEADMSLRRAKQAMVQMEAGFAEAPKEIKKEGLSEYFLYTIEGTETIPHGWAKRLPSFNANPVPVVNLYKYEEERYGSSVVRFLSFKNDEEHKLGETPIPGGIIKVYRSLDTKGHLSYEGRSNFKYIPVDEDVELNLGIVSNVLVEPTLMKYRTDNYQFDKEGDVSGWDEIREFVVQVKNTRDVAAKVEIRRNFPTSHWDIKKSAYFGAFEKVDLDTVKFTLDLKPRSKKEFTYILTTFHGSRER